MTECPDISVVIPAYNRADLLERCLGSLRASGGATWEATVVDNASPEDLSSVRERFPEVRWIRSEQNLGYAEANNLGLRDANGRHVCFLNSDAMLSPDTLARLIDRLEADSAIGAITPRNVGPDGQSQRSCWLGHTLAMAWLQDSGLAVLFPRLGLFRRWSGPEFDFDREQDVRHSQFTCLVVRGVAYRQVGEMDPRLFLFYNDNDYCVRLHKARWRILYVPEPRVVHLGSASVKTAPWAERQMWRDRYRYCAKWYGLTGTIGVRFAILSRAAALMLLHTLRGRFGMAREAIREAATTARAIRTPDMT